MRKIPYIYHCPNKPKPWIVFIRHEGRQVWVGAFEERVNAFVEYNRVAGELRVGLLPLQRAKTRLKRMIEEARGFDERALDVLLDEAVMRELPDEDEEIMNRIFGIGSD